MCGYDKRYIRASRNRSSRLSNRAAVYAAIIALSIPGLSNNDIERNWLNLDIDEGKVVNYCNCIHTMPYHACEIKWHMSYDCARRHTRLPSR
jgi:hypothetical protein